MSCVVDGRSKTPRAINAIPSAVSSNDRMRKVPEVDAVAPHGRVGRAVGAGAEVTLLPGVGAGLVGPDGQARQRQLHRLGGLGLEDDRHLGDHAVGRGGGAEPLPHRLVEGQVLVGQGAEERPPGAGDQLGEGGVAVDPEPHGDLLGEAADERLDLAPVAVGDNGGDHQIVLAGDVRPAAPAKAASTVMYGVARRLRGQGADPGGEGRREVDAEGAGCGSGVLAGRQLRGEGGAGQLLAPPGPLRRRPGARRARPAGGGCSAVKDVAGSARGDVAPATRAA